VGGDGSAIVKERGACGNGVSAEQRGWVENTHLDLGAEATCERLMVPLAVVIGW
jgi:hypothetical protein